MSPFPKVCPVKRLKRVGNLPMPLLADALSDLPPWAGPYVRDADSAPEPSVAQEPSAKSSVADHQATSEPINNLSGAAELLSYYRLAALIPERVISLV
jgi:hypothetical protein